jgi:hypothetical protein
MYTSPVEGTSRPELFEWCLAHGASTDLPTTQNDERRPILERAASIGDIATFGRLRQKGALLSTRMLPLAVRSANDLVPMTDQPPSETYEAPLNIVGHLIDNLGVDVNNNSCWACNTCSTPLCCIDCYTKNDATQLIWLLLDKGGNSCVPGSSGDTDDSRCTSSCYNETEHSVSKRAFETWKMRNGGSE